MPKGGANTWLVGLATILVVFLAWQRLRIFGLQYLLQETALECPISVLEGGPYRSVRSTRGEPSLAECIGAEWRPVLSQDCVQLRTKQGFRYLIRYTQLPDVGFSVCMKDLPTRFHWPGGRCGFVEVREEPKAGAFWFWRESPDIAPAQYVALDPECASQAISLPSSGWELPWLY
jgi:hypothetical protein